MRPEIAPVRELSDTPGGKDPPTRTKVSAAPSGSRPDSWTDTDDCSSLVRLAIAASDGARLVARGGVVVVFFAGGVVRVGTAPSVEVAVADAPGDGLRAVRLRPGSGAVANGTTEAASKPQRRPSVRSFAVVNA